MDDVAAEDWPVALLAMPESTPGALTGLFEVLSSVGTGWPDPAGRRTAAVPMPPRIVSRDGAPIAGAVGLPIQPQGRLEDAADAGIVIVSDIAFGDGFEPRGRWAGEVAWLRARHAAGATICTVCTGALVLAESGLLDGQPATTHWLAEPVMRRCYPKVRLETGEILVRAGADGRIVTSGGASSWEDLVLYLIARFSGGAEAVRIAKLFLFGDRSEGQRVFAGAAPARRHDDAAVHAAQGWAAENYALPNPVAGMTVAAGLPERTFKRRFRQATGLTPLDYVQTLRIEEAKQLLETTDLATDAVAAEVGYLEPAFFRRLFRRCTGVTPARYRRRFARIARPA